MDVGASFFSPIQALQQVQIGRQQMQANQQALETERQQQQMNQQKIAGEQMKLDAQRIYQDALSKMTSGGDMPQDPLEQLEWAANLAMKTGRPEKAAKMLATVEQVRVRQGAQEKTMQAMAAREQKEKVERLSRFASLAADVTDEAGWQRANMSYQLATGEESPMAKIPWRPGLNRDLVAASMTAKDRREDERKERESANKASYYKTRLAHEARRTALAERNTALRERRATVQEKNGGAKPLGVPLERDVTYAKTFLKDMDLTADDLTNTAYDVAIEAKEMMRRVPGLSMSEASARAVEARVKSGDLRPGKKATSIFGGRTPGTSFSAARPAALPATQDKLIQGQYYNTAKGLAKWNGSAFTPVAKGNAAEPDDNEPDDNEPDDDEDD